VGYEFRIKTFPCIESISEMVAPVLEESERIIDSSLSVATSKKLGVASALTAETSWPQCCDMMIDETGAIYAIGHNRVGCQIVYRLAQHLRAHGYAVEIDDDV
jgi:hypothetical protein